MTALLIVLAIAAALVVGWAIGRSMRHAGESFSSTDDRALAVTLEDVLERHPTGVVIGDADGDVEYRNAAARRLAGTHTGLLIDEAILTGHGSTSLGLLACVLGLSFAPTVGRALAAGRRAFLLTALLTIAASAAYFGWHLLFEVIAPEINAGSSSSDLMWAIVVGGLVLLFVAQSILQINPNGRFSNWLQPHLLGGLYIDDWFTRVTFRLWPPGF